MNDKAQLISMLREEFNRWEELLSGLSEEQIIAPDLIDTWSIKDVIAHLRAWQQTSVARLEAAVQDREPQFPGWVAQVGEDWEEDTERTNALIYATQRDRPWPGVYRDWKEGFLRFLEAAQAIPEKDLLDAGKYPWLSGDPLSVVLQGSYEHHHMEHLEPLLALLRER